MINYKDFAKTALVLAAVTACGFLLDRLGLSQAIITGYILGVLVTAAVTSGILYSIAASLVSVLLFN